MVCGGLTQPLPPPRPITEAAAEHVFRRAVIACACARARVTLAAGAPDGNAESTMTVPADRSLRFVLPADAPYLNNMAALWAVAPGIAAEIEATDGPESYSCEPSKAGPPTVAIGGRALHSKYDPV